MIPTIEDILADLAGGRMTPEKAMGWISQHMKLAQDLATEPTAYMYQHDETGRVHFKMPEERADAGEHWLQARRYYEFPLYRKWEAA